MTEKDSELPKPKGICKYCGKPVYMDLEKHENICRFESETD